MKNNILTLIFICSLCFFTDNVLAQRQKDLDSLLTLLKTLPDDVKKIQTYYKLAWHYCSSQSYTDIVRKYADSIKILSEKLDFEKGISWYHFYYGSSRRHDGDYPEALVHLNKFISYSASIGDSISIANGLHQLSAIQNSLGNYDKSLSINLRMLNIYQMERRPIGVSTALSNIAGMYFRTGKYDLGIESTIKALRLMDSIERGKPNQGSAYCLSQLGHAFQQKNQLDEAKINYEKALKMNQEIGSDWGIAGGFEDLGYLLSELKEYDKALNYYLRSLPIRERLSQKIELGYCLNNIGYMYMKLKEYSLSDTYLKQSLSIAREAELQPLMSSIYENLSQLKAKQNDFQEAYNYHRFFKNVDDSIFNKTSTNQINELQIRYQTAQKDQEIALLTRENEVQQANAKQQKTFKNALIGGIFLLSIITGLIFYTLRSRLKNQKLIATKNEEIRLSKIKGELGTLEMKALRAQMNPHFLFNCMNSINRMIMAEENDKASKYLSKFSKLVRLMLENSEQPKVSLQDELQMLESYIQLEAIRFKNKLDYHIEVEKSIDKESTYLPSMVLQPFVENAIWHGLMHKKSRGHLEIYIKETKDELHCTITDDGVGREKSLQLQTQNGHHKKSMGIKITADRLRLLTKEKIKKAIEIVDLKDKANRASGTQVNVSIPIS